MNKFVLKSKYQPTGDQPSAIAQLVAGLEKGDKEQTLLGVTGSGKSVTGDTKVLLRRNGRYYHVSIDSLDVNFSELPAGTDVTQYVPLGNELSTIAIDPVTAAVTVEEVAEISRHRYSGEQYTVTTTAGHQNTFTDSHNVYVLRDGDLCLTESGELQVGDFVPAPSRLPGPSHGERLTSVDLTEWVAKEDFYVSLSPEYVAPVQGVSKRKAWAMRHASERVAIEQYHVMRTIAPVAALTIGSKNYTSTVPASLGMSSELMRFIGLFIAEGHAAGKYSIISTADASIRSELEVGAQLFGKVLRKREGTYDYVVGGTIISTLLKTWVGRVAGEKHLPVFWPQLSDEHLGALLSGIFAGDGCVETNSATLSTVSRELASDVQLALTRFGVQARIRQKWVLYRGERRLSWILSVSGRSNLSAFQDYVGFGLARKDSLLAALNSRDIVENTNTDVMPVQTKYIAQLMSKYDLYQSDVASAIGVSRSLISMYLSGKRLPSRQRAKKLYEYLSHVATGHGDVAYVQRLKHLVSLACVTWHPIASIKKEIVDTVMYDLSVPGKQTFLANGYFVHNTFTMANIIAKRNAPTLVLAHNKTLAAQLFSEFKAFFPDNEVHYFVSYFDYYQPEAYIASSDTYIEKDSAINEEIDRLRHAATSALLTRRDVIIVASVSCIYGIGSPEDYAEMSIKVKRGERRVQDRFVRLLTDIQYSRNDIDFHRGTFRVRGDVVDVFPAGSDTAYRIEFFGDDVDRITQIDPLTGEILSEPDSVNIFPSSHYVTPKEKVARAVEGIKKEFDERMAYFEKHDKYLEAQRLAQRTKYDIEMLEETGFVKGIENYSRYLTNREPGEQPATLLDYFPDDFLLFIDESHVSVSQVRGMYNGDRARKEVLVEYGFRLPSALDNRPLRFDEFERHINQVIYVSATPGNYELEHSPEPVQQVIRPTGLLDPPIDVRPVDTQVDDLIAEIRDRTAKHQRVLVTTLTKRMAEDLSTHLIELGIKTAYIHSEIDTLERGDILRDLRMGVYDVLVGINLLREGLDLPEVSLVAILDADKEGFLRSESSLIQTIGRAARHVEGRVIMYADRVTDSMRRAIEETNRRREIQASYNTEHNITPRGVDKAIDEGLRAIIPQNEDDKKTKLNLNKIPKDEYASLVKDLTGQMNLASANLEFERAAELRDVINEIKGKM